VQLCHRLLLCLLALQCLATSGASAVPAPGAAHLKQCAGQYTAADPEQAFVCALQCPDSEPALSRGFRQWWDVSVTAATAEELCVLMAPFALTFVGYIVGGQVRYRCCSSEECEGSHLRNVRGRPYTDLDLLLGIIQEVATATRLPDLAFTFNIGDQPFLDRLYWAPVPHFHWVESLGHHGIPLPNPFHLKALAGGKLGQLVGSMPWKDKVAKVFWRGSLSGPDRLAWSVIGALPRLRLQRLARERPELFDVGFTGVDETMPGMTKKQLRQWRGMVETRPSVPFDQVLPQYKFLLNVGAVLSSWRLVELLRGGSVLLLQEDTSWEVAHTWLEPWVHYVPVHYELDDLVEKVEWLVANDGEAEKNCQGRGAGFRIQRHCKPHLLLRLARPAFLGKRYSWSSPICRRLGGGGVGSAGRLL